MDSFTTATGGYDALSALFSGTAGVITIIFYVLLVVAYWKIFEKAGIAGWLSIIPFVNMYFMYKIAMGKGWLFLLTFIPIVNIVITIILNVKLAKAYGHGGGFALGLIFLAPIFLLILGFEDSRYMGPQ